MKEDKKHEMLEVMKEKISKKMVKKGKDAMMINALKRHK